MKSCPVDRRAVLFPWGRTQGQQDAGKHRRGCVQGTLLHPSPVPYSTRHLRTAQVRVRAAGTGRTGLLCLWLFRVPAPSRVRGPAGPSMAALMIPGARRTRPGSMEGQQHFPVPSTAQGSAANHHCYLAVLSSPGRLEVH